MALRVLFLLATLLLTSTGEAARSKARAPKPASSDGSCPAGMRRTLDGNCSRCAAANAKARETCNGSWTNCTERCEAALDKCLSNPRALNCDAKNGKCTAGCDKTKTGCYASAEKTYQSCRVKEGRR